MALAAEKMPMTRPRWVWNQRLATIAPSTRAIAPVPMPMNAPQQPQLPRLRSSRGSARWPTPTSVERRRDHAADAEALHERRRERRGEAVEHQVEADRARGHRPRPAELLLERHEQRTGRRAEAGRRDQRGQGDGRRPTRPGGPAAPASDDRRWRSPANSRCGCGGRAALRLPPGIDPRQVTGRFTYRRTGCERRCRYRPSLRSWWPC